MFRTYFYNPIYPAKSRSSFGWSFVEEGVADCYSEKGQRAIHPVKIFKLLICQNLYNLSECEVCEQADCNIIFRYFIGLGLNDDIPHWTDLDKFKERISVERFERLFYCVLGEAEKLGIKISTKRTADSTDVLANVDLRKIY